jgi:type II secretory pathway pseudopilin PulG
MIELLVAMVITAMMLTLVMASYWTFLQTQQRLAISRELQSEVRFTLNRFTDKVRASRIDYTAYEPGNSCALGDPGGDIKLCLIDARGDTFYFENDLTVGNESLVMGNNPANAQFLISPNKFNVNSVSFSFSPALNPRDLAAPQMQPKVTFYLSVSPTNPTYADLVIESQTTISSRQY